MKKFPTIMSVACFIFVPSAASSLLQRIFFSKPGFECSMYSPILANEIMQSIVILQPQTFKFLEGRIQT